MDALRWDQMGVVLEVVAVVGSDGVVLEVVAVVGAVGSVDGEGGQCMNQS